MNKIEGSLNAHIQELKKDKVISAKNISDGWHTIGELYTHRKEMPKCTDGYYRDIFKMSVKEFYEHCKEYGAEDFNILNELALITLINSGQINSKGKILNKKLLNVREINHTRVGE